MWQLPPNWKEKEKTRVKYTLIPSVSRLLCITFSAHYNANQFNILLFRVFILSFSSCFSWKPQGLRNPTLNPILPMWDTSPIPIGSSHPTTLHISGAHVDCLCTSPLTILEWILQSLNHQPCHSFSWEAWWKSYGTSLKELWENHTTKASYYSWRV